MFLNMPVTPTEGELPVHDSDHTTEGTVTTNRAPVQNYSCIINDEKVSPTICPMSGTHGEPSVVCTHCQARVMLIKGTSSNFDRYERARPPSPTTTRTTVTS